MIPKIIITKTKKRACEIIANEIILLIKANPKADLGFATGHTFVDTYQDLVSDYKNNNTDWSNICSYNLDEIYISDLKREDETFFNFMEEHLFSGVNLKKENIHFPHKNDDGTYNYHKLLKPNLIDLQILGMGINGHVAYNEPGSELDSLTRNVTLTKQTLIQTDYLAKKAITMGVKEVLMAKKLITAIFGDSKVEASRKFLLVNKYSSAEPISCVLFHPNSKIYFDVDTWNKIIKAHSDAEKKELNKKFQITFE